MESIKAFDKTKDLQVTATDISPDKRGLDIVPYNTELNPLYTNPVIGIDKAISTFDLYQLNGLDETSLPSVLFVGLTKSDGTWLIKRFNETTGSMVYANNSNNSSYSDYVTAWSQRDTLTYGMFHEIAGV